MLRATYLIPAEQRFFQMQLGDSLENQTILQRLEPISTRLSQVNAEFVKRYKGNSLQLESFQGFKLVAYSPHISPLT